MTGKGAIAGYLLGIAAIDLAVLAMPIPLSLKAGLAPFIAGAVAGLLARSRAGAILLAVAGSIVAVLVALGLNYLVAPLETSLAVNKPGALSFLPFIVQVVASSLASLGTRFLREAYTAPS